MTHSDSAWFIPTHSQSFWLILCHHDSFLSFWLRLSHSDSLVTLMTLFPHLWLIHIPMTCYDSRLTHPHPYDLLWLTSDSMWLRTWVEASHSHDSLWLYVLGKFPRYLYKRTVFSSWKYNHFTLHNLPHLPLLHFAHSLEQLSTLVEPKSLLQPSPSSTSLRQVRLGFD